MTTSLLNEIKLFELVALALVPLMVLGIHWMRSPRSAARGNAIGAAGMIGLILVTIIGHDLTGLASLWIWMALGTGAGIGLAMRVRMIQMPELVALFNGLGGGASAIVALLALQTGFPNLTAASGIAALLAAGIGTLTFSGSMVAVLKLARVLDSKPLALPGHSRICLALLAVLTLLIASGAWTSGTAFQLVATLIPVIGLVFGLLFMIRVGGADMPVSISLLNALSGTAAAVAGYAVGNPVPVAVGAMVGTAGLMLTRIMCRAMNRRLGEVLAGRGGRTENIPGFEPSTDPAPRKSDPVELLANAKRVAIVPGYGMALAQAQQAVKKLYDVLQKRNVNTCFAIHPVAGRMPGHMHILLAEVNIPYELFRDLDDVNPDMHNMDLALIVGANDVVNPAANSAEGTPISGMPVINVDQAGAVIVCNLDAKPGYAGVPNPLFKHPKTVMCLGDAADTVAKLADALESRPAD